MKFDMEEKENTPGSGTVNFERRQHPRVSIDLPVEYGPAGTFGARPGRTGDLSEGGLLLNLPEEMPIGQNLWLKVFIAREGESRSVEALVQVVWKDFSGKEKDGVQRVGVKIEEISPDHLGRLEAFVRSRILPKKTPALNLSPRVLSFLGFSAEKREDLSG